MRNHKGFSLIELLIVIAIILVIAAIAIPNLLKSRVAANESSAVSSVRQIKTAEVAYYSAYPSVGYAAALTNLGGPDPCTPKPVTACLLDDFLANSGPGSTGKSGYFFAATGIAPGGGVLNSEFVVGGAPVSAGQTGNRNFCAISDGVLRFQPGSPGSMPVTAVATCVAFPSIVQ
jgi:type IV pilus assembly protein PilA